MRALVMRVFGRGRDPIEKYIDYLSSRDVGQRRKAAKDLGALALNAENQILIAQAGGIAPLVGLLGDADAKVRRNAANALGKIAKNSENKVLIAEEGGIAPLVGLLEDADIGVRRQAVVAVWVLALNAENQALIANAGGGASLLSLLGDADAEVRERALQILINVAVSAKNQVLIAQAEGIATLVDLLGDADSQVRKNAVHVLVLLAKNARNKRLIVSVGGISALMVLLCGSDVDTRTRRYAANVLKSLVNVALFYQGVRILLEAQVKKERDKEIISDIQYILRSCKKDPAPPSLHKEISKTISSQGSSESSSSKISSSQESSESITSKTISAREELAVHLFAPNGDPSQRESGPDVGAYIIQASEVQLGRRLGRGAFGDVYEAMYQFQKVAVKKYFGAEMHPQNRAKIMAEIMLMATLKQKYLVAFLGVIEEPSGSLSLVMECAEKGSLYDYLHAHRDIAWSWRLRVAEELARGLAYLHEKNVVHRDIKSLNVVLDEDLHAKWCDFGLAVLKQHVMATHGHGNKAVGTVRWMAPELFEDEPVVSQKGDIWSYGMVLFELATQTVPYHHLNEEQVIGRLMKHKAEKVPEVCRRRVPKFAGLMEACWKVQEARPEASRLIEVLVEARAECSEVRAESVVSDFIGLSGQV